MRALIGFSRCRHTLEAFESQGFEAWTCDTLPSADRPDRHLQCDIWDVAHDNWDVAIFHPMCTYLTVSAAWAFGDGPYHQRVMSETLVGAARRKARKIALDTFRRLDALPYPHAIENPAPSFVSTMYRQPDQTIQPYDFGENASKRTGLWLRGLPKLQPTWFYPPRIVNGRKRWGNQTDGGQNRLTPSADRWLERSKTYPGIASAMGAQFGGYIAERNK